MGNIQVNKGKYELRNIILTVIFMLGLWFIDVSVTTINMGNGLLYNGFWFMNPVVGYHSGIYIVVISFLLLYINSHREVYFK